MDGHPPAIFPVKVALIDPGDFTPAYDLALARGLIGVGYEVRQFGRHGFNETIRSTFREDHFYGSLDHRLLRPVPAALRRVVKAVSHGFDMVRLAGVLAAWKPSIIHAQWLPLPAVDKLVWRRVRATAPLVLTLHDSNPYNGAVSRLMRAGYLGTVALADAVIVHTTQAECRLIEAGIGRDRIHRVPHGLLHDAADDAATRRERNDIEPLRLLQFGKIRPYKGVDVLLRAVAALAPSERAHLRVRIVGRPYMDAAPLRRFVAQNNLSDTVDLRLDFVEEREIAGLFDWADAAVFPYREIDASGVAMAAVAHGLPVLASEIGGFKEQFVDNREARMVRPDDPEALAGVLREWIADPHQVDRLATAMRTRKQMIPDWTEIARDTIRVYTRAQAVWARRCTTIGRRVVKLSS